MDISCDFAIIDVKKRGRGAITRALEKGSVPVTIKGYIFEVWNNDGVSIEFRVTVTSVVTEPARSGTAHT